jgi:hypothetical protein
MCGPLLMQRKPSERPEYFFRRPAIEGHSKKNKMDKNREQLPPNFWA